MVAIDRNRLKLHKEILDDEIKEAEAILRCLDLVRSFCISTDRGYDDVKKRIGFMRGQIDRIKKRQNWIDEQLERFRIIDKATENNLDNILKQLKASKD